MFESLDIVISLGVVLLILSIFHKHLMSVKRPLRIKAKGITDEVQICIGENTTKFYWFLI